MPTVAINADGTFTADVATGGIDNRATIFAAALVPVGITPPFATNASRIPESLAAEAVDFVERYGRTIEFAGRMWGVKESPVDVGPGGNHFSGSSSDVFVDSQGRLHLTLSFRDGQWYSSEVVLTEHLGFGTYAFQSSSDTSQLDPNVIFGAFTFDAYGDDEKIAEWPYREIDFEDGRFGQAADSNDSQIAVQPFNVSGNVQRFKLPDLSGDPSLTRFFRWDSDQIDFTVLKGFHDPLSFPAEHLFQQFSYVDDAADYLVPTEGRESFRFNVWLFDTATQPMNGQTVEVVIPDFMYYPLSDLIAPSAPTDIDASSNHVVSQAANGTPVGIRASAIDQEGATITYSLTDNAGGRFAINRRTGVISVANGSAIDFATSGGSYSVTVLASDGVQGTSSNFTITVNDAPVFLDDDFFIYKRAKTGTAVGKVSASDIDAGQTLSYSIVAGNNGAYSIDAVNGVITVADMKLLAGAGPNITVRATDNGSPAKFDDALVTINLKATNAAPVVSLTDGANAPVNIDRGKAVLTLDEHTPTSTTQNGLLIGTLAVADVDDPLGTFDVAMTDRAGAFDYDAATGRITIRDAAKLSFEAGKSVTLTFKVTDHPLPGSTSVKTTTVTLTIQLTDLNEAAVFTSPAAFSAAENNKAGLRVGTVKAVDPDKTEPNKTLAYSIVSQQGSTGVPVDLFAIDAARGTMTVKDAGTLDFEAHPFFTLVVRATDGGSPARFTEQTITVNIADLNEAPTIEFLDAAQNPATMLSVLENTAIGTVIGFIRVTNPDAIRNETFTITESSTRRGAVTLGPFNAVTGLAEIRVAGALDFETIPGTQFVFTVTVKDSGFVNNAGKKQKSTTAKSALTVKVDDVAE